MTLLPGGAAAQVDPAATGLAVLAVPDPTVAAVAAGLRVASRDASAAVLHVSGALGLAPLEPARARGWLVGSFHPLQSFPAEREAAAFKGITVAVDGSAPGLIADLERLAADLGGRPKRVPDADRSLYHAAAVLGSNYVVALVGVAAAILAKAGWTRDEAVAALVPLLRGVADNLEESGLPAALTGPVARGDVDTVRRHLEAVEGAESAPRLHARVYRIVGLAALELAREAGLDETAARRIEEALTG